MIKAGSGWGLLVLALVIGSVQFLCSMVINFLYQEGQEIVLLRICSIVYDFGL
jgi:hypothetical protein